MVLITVSAKASKKNYYTVDYNLTSFSETSSNTKNSIPIIKDNDNGIILFIKECFEKNYPNIKVTKELEKKEYSVVVETYTIESDKTKKHFLKDQKQMISSYILLF